MGYSNLRSATLITASLYYISTISREFLIFFNSRVKFECIYYLCINRIIMLLLTYIREHNEIPICDDVFKHVLLPFLTIYDLLKSVTTTKQFKKLIQNIIPDHPYNLHNAIWEGPSQPYYFHDRRYCINPFIIPENPQNYIWVGANLNGANLNGANLNGANLNGANLNGADLDGADLTDAKSGRYSC
jgi:uncharacterized protein YjbI with pentapeptide repeats